MATNKRRRRLRLAKMTLGMLSLLVIVSILTAPSAMAQTPPVGVDGPWLDIFQIFWFTDDPNYDHTDKGTTYAPNAARRYDYGQNRHPQCYYYSIAGPDADWINALYDMMSCRIGLVTGAITWIGVGIALMTLAWGGVMWVVDSNSGGDRAGALRNMITGPLIGLMIMFFSYGFAKFLYAVIRYNFEKYLDPDLWT